MAKVGLLPLGFALDPAAADDLIATIEDSRLARSDGALRLVKNNLHTIVVLGVMVAGAAV